MIEFVIKLYKADPSLFVGMIGLFLIVITIMLYLIFYIYMNINLKGISKIVFNDEKNIEGH